MTSCTYEYVFKQLRQEYFIDLLDGVLRVVEHVVAELTLVHVAVDDGSAVLWGLGLVLVRQPGRHLPLLALRRAQMLRLADLGLDLGLRLLCHNVVKLRSKGAN